MRVKPCSLYFFCLFLKDKHIYIYKTYIVSIERVKRELKGMKICISFKETTRDITLYNAVQSKEKYEKSEFVKDCIEFYLKSLENNNQ